MELLILAVPFVLLLLLMSRQRKMQRELFAAQTSATPGTKVVTTAGLHATVVEVDGETVLLETAPGQTSRWARQAIARVVDESPAEPADDDEPVAARETGEPGAPPVTGAPPRQDPDPA